MGCLWREMPISRAFFYTSPDLKKNLTSLSKSRVKSAPPYSSDKPPVERDAPSLVTLVYLIIYNSQSPQLWSSLTKWGGKHMVTIRRATCGQKAYIEFGVAWFPRGWFMTLLSLPSCYAAFSTIPSTLACVDQTSVSQHVSCTPLTGCPFHTCYPSHMTQGTYPYNPEVWTRGYSYGGRFPVLSNIIDTQCQKWGFSFENTTLDETGCEFDSSGLAV
jgi:hypothetical protein